MAQLPESKSDAGEKRMSCMKDSLLAVMPGVRLRALARNRVILRFTLFLLAPLFGLSLCAAGQQGTILGTVTDPAGAVVANVNITITNLESGVAKVIPTNSDGQYVVPDLNIGRYSVKAEANSFKTVERKTSRCRWVTALGSTSKCRSAKPRKQYRSKRMRCGFRLIPASRAM